MYEEYLGINISRERGIIYTEWLRGISNEEYEKSLLHVHTLIKRYKLKFWLVQASIFTAPNMPEQKWTIYAFFPLLVKTPLLKIAFVLPGDYILHMLGESMTQKVYSNFGKKILIECFTRVDHARHWLTNPDEQTNLYLYHK